MRLMLFRTNEKSRHHGVPRSSAHNVYCTRDGRHNKEEREKEIRGVAIQFPSVRIITRERARGRMCSWTIDILKTAGEISSVDSDVRAS